MEEIRVVFMVGDTVVVYTGVAKSVRVWKSVIGSGENEVPGHYRRGIVFVQ